MTALKLEPTERTEPTPMSRFSIPEKLNCPRWVKQLSSEQRFLLLYLGRSLVGTPKEMLKEDFYVVFPGKDFEKSLKPLIRRGLIQEKNYLLKLRDAKTNPIRILIQMEKVKTDYLRWRYRMKGREGAIILAVLLQTEARTPSGMGRAVVSLEEFEALFDRFPQHWSEGAPSRWKNEGKLSATLVLDYMVLFGAIKKSSGRFVSGLYADELYRTFFFRSRLFQEWFNRE